MVYGDAGYQGIAKRLEMTGKTREFRVAMRPGKCRALPDTPEGRLQDLIEAAKPHISSKGEHPFQVIKEQFGLQEIKLPGLAKNCSKINVLAALSNLFEARKSYLRQPDHKSVVPEYLDSASNPA